MTGQFLRRCARAAGFIRQSSSSTTLVTAHEGKGARGPFMACQRMRLKAASSMASGLSRTSLSLSRASFPASGCKYLCDRDWRLRPVANRARKKWFFRDFSGRIFTSRFDIARRSRPTSCRGFHDFLSRRFIAFALIPESGVCVYQYRSTLEIPWEEDRATQRCDPRWMPGSCCDEQSMFRRSLSTRLPTLRRPLLLPLLTILIRDID